MLREIERNEVRYLVWSGEDIGKKLILLGRFEAGETAYFRKNIRPGDVCIDVGGNIGYYALNFSKACSGKGGKVFVFEPIERNALVIKLSAQRNGLENIEVIESAVSNSKRECSLETPDGDSGYAYISFSKDSERKSVSCTTIDDFVGSRDLKRIAVLKVDVEGAEHLVLLGAKNLLSDNRARPGIIMVELVDEFLSRYGSSIDEVMKYMVSFGYKPFFASDDGRLISCQDNDMDSIFNIFFIHD